MKKTKLIERFSVFSKYDEGYVTLSLVFNEGNILLNELIKSVKNEQEAKLMYHAYFSLMIEKEMAIYSVTQHLAKIFHIDNNGKSVNEIVKLINQKVKELKR